MLYDKRWETTEAPVTPKLERWRQILLDAADYLETHGWVQRTLRKGDRACALGAIQAIAPYDGTKDYYYAAHALAAHVGAWVACWNDVPGRTKEQVIAEMRATARTGATS